MTLQAERDAVSRAAEACSVGPLDIQLRFQTEEFAEPPGSDPSACDTPQLHRYVFDDAKSEESDDDENFIFTKVTPNRPRKDPSYHFVSYEEQIAKVAMDRFLDDRKQSQAHSETPLGPDDKPHGMEPDNPDIGASTPDRACSGFPCPFYIRNPKIYHSCLHENLRHVIDIKRHIWVSHQRPPDCPICGAIFDTNGACEAHIRQKECKLSASLPDIDGVSEEQLYQLADLTGSSRSNEEEWLRIWNVVFPDAVPRDGFMDDEALRQVKLLRSFWERNGRDIIVTRLLESNGVNDDDLRHERHNLRILYDAILGRMTVKFGRGLEDGHEKH